MTAHTNGSAAQVCVVGSFMMDLVIRAPRRPAPGETVLGTSFQTFLGGKGFNQAIAAARSGASTALVGRVGDDDFGGAFLAALDREHIDRAGVTVDALAGTGVGVPLVEDSGENSIVVVPRANSDLTIEALHASARLIAASRVLLLQLELPLPTMVEAARIARDAGVIVVLNPAPAVASLAAFNGLVDIVVPNESEARTLTGLPCAGEQTPRVAGLIREQTGAGGVVLTLGAEGVMVLGDGEAELIEPHRVSAVDTVGAGDAFCGAMASKLAAGASLVEAARYGNAAGALAVTRHGAEPSMPFAADIEELLLHASRS